MTIWIFLLRLRLATRWVAFFKKAQKDKVCRKNKNHKKGEKMSILKELWQFLRVRKKFWLFPIILVMLFLGALIVLGQGSAIAPFIYTIF